MVVPLERPVDSALVRVTTTWPEDEDRGVLMGFVTDKAAGRSRLEVLDAQTLETLGSVGLPARVPHGFHGSWVPAAS